jgi:hypothetical protein
MDSQTDFYEEANDDSAQIFPYSVALYACKYELNEEGKLYCPEADISF